MHIHIVHKMKRIPNTVLVTMFLRYLVFHIKMDSCGMGFPILFDIGFHILGQHLELQVAKQVLYINKATNRLVLFGGVLVHTLLTSFLLQRGFGGKNLGQTGVRGC